MRLYFEDPSNEGLLNWVRDPFKLVLPFVHKPLELVVGLCLKGVAAFPNRVGDHSKGPDIGLLSNVLFATKDLGGHIIGRPTDGIEFAVTIS